MTDKKQQAQVFILIAIVALAILAVIVFLFIQGTRVRASPTVQEAFWQMGDSHVSTAVVGEEIAAHLIIQTKDEYVGSVVIKIRKDVSYWSDRDYSVKTLPLNLAGGQTIDLELQFVPDEASQGSMRGYFIEAEFPVTRTSWVMENSYPPRLRLESSLLD